MFHKNKASAKIDSGRLILSMPDAETPALWMLDLSDALTTVIRVELDKQGLYVLKKHGGKGAPETIGVYRDKRRAVRALNTITRTLDNARSNDNSAPNGDRVTRILVIILLVWFALFRLGGFDTMLLSLPFPSENQASYTYTDNAEEMAEYDAKITEILSRMYAEQGMAPVPPPAQTPPAPSAGQAGIPQSADEFLLNRATQ